MFNRKQQQAPDDGWGVLGQAVGLLVLAKVGIAVALSLGTGGLGWAVGLLAFLALCAAASGTAGTGGGFGLGGLFRSLWTPRVLGGSSARWSTALDLYRAGWLGFQSGGWPIGTYRALWGLWPVTVRIPSHAQAQHLLCLAPNGAGKTDSVMRRFLVAETRLPADQKQCGVITDLKANVTHGIDLSSYRVWTWNVRDPLASTIQFDTCASIPPVTDPRFQEAATNVAEAYYTALHRDPTGLISSVTGEPYWQLQGTALLTSLIMYLRATIPDATMIDVMRYVCNPTQTPEKIVADLMCGGTKVEALALQGTMLRELLLNEKARGAVIGDLVQKLTILADPRIQELFGAGSLPVFSTEEFVRVPTLLVLQVGALGDRAQNLLATVASMIQSDLMRLTQGGKKLPHPVRFLLDEAGSLRIAGLPTALATMREANCGYALFVQDLAQLTELYGRAGAAIIRANCNHVFALGGTGGESAHELTKDLGRRFAYQNLASSNHKGEESYHYSLREWALLRPDELRHMRRQGVLDSSHLWPLKVDLERYTADL